MDRLQPLDVHWTGFVDAGIFECSQRKRIRSSTENGDFELHGVRRTVHVGPSPVPGVSKVEYGSGGWSHCHGDRISRRVCVCGPISPSMLAVSPEADGMLGPPVHVYGQGALSQPVVHIRISVFEFVGGK